MCTVTFLFLVIYLLPLSNPFSSQQSENQGGMSSLPSLSPSSGLSLLLNRDSTARARPPPQSVPAKHQAFGLKSDSPLLTRACFPVFGSRLHNSPSLETAFCKYPFTLPSTPAPCLCTSGHARTKILFLLVSRFGAGFPMRTPASWQGPRLT